MTDVTIHQTDQGLTVFSEVFICNTSEGKRYFEIVSQYGTDGANTASTAIRAILKMSSGSEIHGAYMPGIVTVIEINNDEKEMLAYHKAALKLLFNQVTKARKLYRN